MSSLTLLEMARELVDKQVANQELYVAKWILDNPNENIDDWTLCKQTVYPNSYYPYSPDGCTSTLRIWMERKENLTEK